MIVASKYMDVGQAPYRFDVFEQRKIRDASFIVWHGTYRTLAEAEENLGRCAAASPNEFYIKDLQLGIVVARSNVADTTSDQSLELCHDSVTELEGGPY
jgi:hypothetical protein